jgi:predicted ATPase with chaperone activity
LVNRSDIEVPGDSRSFNMCSSQVVEVPRLTPQELSRAPEGEPTAAVRERVKRAREQMLSRQGKLNRELIGRALRQHIKLAPAAEALTYRRSLG